LKSNHLVTESIDRLLLVFNPSQLKVVHNSLLAFTCNVSLYLALNFLVEKSIDNGPVSSTPSASNFGLKVLVAFVSKKNISINIKF
jgi:hypothetical protein